MKKSINKFIIIGFLSIIAVGCDKFSLLKDENLPAVAAGENLKTETIWDFIASNNFHAHDYTNIGLYSQAVQYAGLKDLLNGDGNFTVVLLNDAAMTTLITNLKGTQLTDIAPAVMRNALLNFIVADNRVRCYDLAVGETRGFQSLSTDSLYFTRNANALTPYLFYVNKTLVSATTTGQSPNTAVRVQFRNQNLDCKNGVVNVVATLPVHDISFSLAAADNPSTSITVATDTLYVTKDSYVWIGVNANVNYNAMTPMLARLSTTADLTRHMLLQFPLRQPKFGSRIGSARFNGYVSYLSGGKGTTATLYEDANTDWDETTLTWNNSPVFGIKGIGTFSVPATGGLNKYYSSDITNNVTTDLSNGKTFINVGIYASGDILGILPKETNNGKNKAYILLTSPPITILSQVNNNPLVVPLSKGIKQITLDELQFAGTSNKNIFYNISTVPTNGSIVRYGIPLTKGDSFTQQDLEKGLVYYLYGGTSAGTDSFVLEPKDYNGGYYSPLVTVPVQIQ